MTQQRGMFTEVGQTPEGLCVVGGVYAFYETFGLPLSDVYSLLWERRAIPDWNLLVDDMVNAGRPFNRSIETIVLAISDACYPIDFAATIITRLRIAR